MTPLRIIFAGTPAFAVIALQALLATHHEVCAVYTQPDRPAGRGRKLVASPVKQTAIDCDIPVSQPISLKDPVAQETLHSLHADLMVVAAYGLILPRLVLAIPRLGCINIHASLLPRWRGAAPIQRAIMAGDHETGISIMQMDSGLDTGAVMLRQHCPILDDDTAANLHDRLAELGAQSLLQALQSIQTGTVQLMPQDDSLANYAAKINKAEADLDWRLDALSLQRKVRAFNPGPIAQTRLSNGQALRIWAAEHLAHDSGQMPGSLLQADKSGIVIATGQGALSLTKLQLPGGRPLSAAEFLNAHRLGPHDFCIAEGA